MRVKLRTLKPVTPLGALFRGLVAGALGAAAQNLFFRVTASVAPKSPRDVFRAPEPEQVNETATQTLGRRFVERLMQRGPLAEDTRQKAGDIVHYAFGAVWGGLYGITRESVGAYLLPSPLLVAGFSTAVWAIGDEIALPAFRLSAWPQRYPVGTHAYAFAAHLAYGTAVAASYELLKRRSWMFASLALRGLLLRRQLLGFAPRLKRLARPALERAVEVLGKRAPFESQLVYGR